MGADPAMLGSLLSQEHGAGAVSVAARHKPSR